MCPWSSNRSKHGRASKCVSECVTAGEDGAGRGGEGTWKLGMSVCVCLSKDKDETAGGSGDQRDQRSPSQLLER